VKRLLIVLLVVSAFLRVFAAEPAYKNSIGMEFVLVPAGSFIMGTPPPVCNCPQDDPFTGKDEYKECMNACTSSVNSDETPAHDVNITKAFYIGKYEVTQDQWYKVMGNNPSYLKREKLGRDPRNHPVESVTWYDAQAFVKKLNELEGGNKYRLPTEAEWEYAALGGENFKYAGSDDANDVAWSENNANKVTHPVGLKKPNGYGIYDMSGNVFEWVQDKFNRNAYAQHVLNDPLQLRGFITFQTNEPFVCLRGGSWKNHGAIDINYQLRNGVGIKSRHYLQPKASASSIGLRIVRITD